MSEHRSRDCNVEPPEDVRDMWAAYDTRSNKDS